MKISKRFFEEVLEYTLALFSHCEIRIMLIKEPKSKESYASYKSVNKYELLGDYFNEVEFLDNASIKFHNYSLSKLDSSKYNEVIISDVNYYSIDSFNGELCFETKEARYIMNISEYC